MLFFKGAPYTHSVWRAAQIFALDNRMYRLLRLSTIKMSGRAELYFKSGLSYGRLKIGIHISGEKLTYTFIFFILQFDKNH